MTALLALPAAFVLNLLGALDIAFVALSIAHISFGYFVFVSHGESFITPSGLFFAADALFVGLAGLLVVVSDRLDPTSEIFITSAAIYGAVILVYLLRFKMLGPVRGTPRIYVDSPAIAPELKSWTWKLGTALVVVGILLNQSGLRLGRLDDGLAFVGLTSLAIGLVTVWSSRRLEWILPRALGIGIGFFAFTETFFTGFGRLIIATLVLSWLLVINMLRPASWQKHLPLLALIPALVVSGITRANMFGDNDTTVAEVLTSGEGLESVYNPLVIFSELVEADSGTGAGAFERQNGATFVEALVIPIPRAAWPDKPIGFGAKLTEWRTPELAGSGQSWAALAYGEWYANFGWLGLAIAPFVFALILSRFDQWHLRRVQRPVNAPLDLLFLLMLVTLMAGIFDYVWIGLATFVARAGERALAIAALAIVAAEIPHFRHGRRRVRRPIEGLGSGEIGDRFPDE